MTWQILQSNVCDPLPLKDNSVQCVVSSPPYWGLRDYGTASWAGGDEGCDHANGYFRGDAMADRPTAGPERGGTGSKAIRYFTNECGKCGATRIDNQIGLERQPEEYVAKLVAVFREVRRVMRDDGTCWLNLGSSYWSDANKGGSGTFNGRNGYGETYGRGKRPNQSRVDAQSCDNDGREQLNYRGSGRVCPDCGDELIACSGNRRRDISRNDQPLSQSEQPHEQINRDNEQRDCVEASRPAFVDGVAHSTILSSCENVQDANDHEDTASTCQLKDQTFFDDGHLSADNSACTYDTVENVRPLNFHKLGTAFVCMACGYSTRMFPPYKAKDLVNIPFLVAEALRADGWWLRSDIIWSKPNAMPESVTDRPTKAHEYIFLLTKSANYYFDQDAVREPGAGRLDLGTMKFPGRIQFDHGWHNDNGSRDEAGRNIRTVWTIATQPYPDAHFATFPEDVAKRCILAGTSERGCCAECGAPWERVVERSPMEIRRSNRRNEMGMGYANGTPSSGTMTKPPESTTLGWQPTCTHNASTSPCVVLDPFSGSGTVPLVADKLNRFGIGLELKSDYCQMASRRCYDDAPLLSVLG